MFIKETFSPFDNCELKQSQMMDRSLQGAQNRITIQGLAHSIIAFRFFFNYLK